MTKGREQIAAIEKELGISLEYKTKEEFSPVDNSYILNEEGLLIALSLNGCSLKDIDFLASCVDLKMLSLIGNKLKDISVLSSLTQLQELNLSSNELSDISALKSLSQLRELYLYDNRLSDISVLESLSQLRTLYLLSNELSDISVLESLSQLEKLQLSHNQVSDISIIASLVKLERLDLSHNKLNDISVLANLKSLNTLNLADNNITILPHAFAQLSLGYHFEQDRFFHYRGIGCNLYHNPIEEPPLKVVKQGRERVVRYWERIAAEGEDTLYEAKLTLVGEGSAGKTSLALRLKDADAELPLEQTGRTRGIETTAWQFAKQGRKKHIAHIWDFGGQDVFFPVHRFFLTEDAVFVLLGNSRHQSHNFDYWIETVSYFGKKSPIILGQTCAGGHQVEWQNLDDYYKYDDFHIIKNQQPAYYYLNLPQNNEGLEAIKKAIIDQIQALPSFGKRIYKSFLRLRNAIEKSKETNLMSFADFRKMHRKYSKEANEEDIRSDADLLHKLGIVLWFKDIDTLKNDVIHNPTWVLNAVYHLLDDPTIENQKGMVYREDFSRIWEDASYADHELLLKNMLKAFKIGFELKNQAGVYMIPALQSVIEEREFENHYKKTEHSRRLKFTFTFMPKGIVNQLSSDRSKLIEKNQVWKNAVIFAKETNRCLVWEDERKRTLHIRLEGETFSELFVLVKDSIEEIIKEYGVAKGELLIACPCPKKDCINRGDKEHDFFSFEKLKNSYRKIGKKAKWVCNNNGLGDQIFMVADLLYGIGLGDTLKEIDAQKFPIADARIIMESSNDIAQLKDTIEDQHEETKQELKEIKEGINDVLDNTSELMRLHAYNQKELNDALDDLTMKQSKALIADLTIIIAEAFEHYQGEHRQFIQGCIEEIKENDKVIDAQLKLAVPLLPLLGISLETNVDLKKASSNLYEKHPKTMALLQTFSTYFSPR